MSNEGVPVPENQCEDLDSNSSVSESAAGAGGSSTLPRNNSSSNLSGSTTGGGVPSTPLPDDTSPKTVPKSPMKATVKAFLPNQQQTRVSNITGFLFSEELPAPKRVFSFGQVLFNQFTLKSSSWNCLNLCY